MVSLQTMVSMEKNKQCFDLDLTITSKKRKRDEEEEKDDAESGGLDLHLDIPLPIEWERCLDIKSGQIHYYNTRTHKRTSKDPRATLEKPKPKPISMPNLDLELNLTCNSKEYNSIDPPKSNSNSNTNSNSNLNSSLNPNSTDQPEMVATVCMRCHMLVMMCKATLSCPNCKFVHPPARDPLGWAKPGFKLLSCKD
ncbi:hypothetical protein FCM35_KLT08054 [Carex littledalei]|uniref:WW domain-containing protein n=1 Tax=Carex littledalei TaxID=544730 RepID=A0A833QNP5_9POAL|nr:hypothetical protein FCM35_KLT08054 [Carex littledalei]